jgi:hypothetical protein
MNKIKYHKLQNQFAAKIGCWTNLLHPNISVYYPYSQILFEEGLKHG